MLPLDTTVLGVDLGFFPSASAFTRIVRERGIKLQDRTLFDCRADEYLGRIEHKIVKGVYTVALIDGRGPSSRPIAAVRLKRELKISEQEAAVLLTTLEADGCLTRRNDFQFVLTKKMYERIGLEPVEPEIIDKGLPPQRRHTTPDEVVRQRVVALLDGKELSVKELLQDPELREHRVTDTTLRRILGDLVRSGRASCREVRGGIGRPRPVYSLSVNGSTPAL